LRSEKCSVGWVLGALALLLVPAGRGRSAMAQNPSSTNFEPEIAATAEAAYDEAVARLLNQPDIVRETIAKRIVALAAKGERDAHALCDKALIADGFLS
jgi:hypothetical protein